MWRLTWMMLGSLALLSCGGGDNDFQPPIAPSPLTVSSPVSELIERYEGSQETYASLRGEIVSQSVEGEFREAIWYERPGKLRSELTGELRDLGALKAGHDRIIDGDDYFLVWHPGRRYCQLDLDDLGSFPAGQRPDDQIMGFPGPVDLSAARIEEQGTVAGRPALRVVIDPTIPARLVWIDSVYGVVLGFENDTETSAIRRSVFTTISFNEDLAESLFKPDVSGYEKLPCEEVVNY